MSDDERHLAFIPVTRVHEWIPLGWEVIEQCQGHHALWSVLGEWKGEGEPKTPKGVML